LILTAGIVWPFASQSKLLFFCGRVFIWPLRIPADKFGGPFASRRGATTSGRRITHSLRISYNFFFSASFAGENQTDMSRTAGRKKFLK
jgi:hypothetical protein